MKHAGLIAIFLCSGLLALAQDTYKTTSGEIHFNASTPLEDIDAINKQVNAIFKESSQGVAAVLLIRDFKFRRKLMQEHFNENFMESEQYPKAYFQGSLSGYDATAFQISQEPQRFTVSGSLTIHGITRPLETTVNIQSLGEDMEWTAAFVLRPEEFGIEVPKILWNKIAEEVDVDLRFIMLRQ